METASKHKGFAGEGEEGQGPGQGKSLVLYTATHPGQPGARHSGAQGGERRSPMCQLSSQGSGKWEWSPVLF